MVPGSAAMMPPAQTGRPSVAVRCGTQFYEAVIRGIMKNRMIWRAIPSIVLNTIEDHLNFSWNKGPAA